MVAINFSPVFVEEVAAGRKRQTIRASTIARAGSTLQLYTGLRTKKARHIMDAVCISVQRVVLMEKAVQVVGNTAITGMFLEDFAKSDGFPTYADMWNFFQHRASVTGEFYGFLIKW